MSPAVTLEYRGGNEVEIAALKQSVAPVEVGTDSAAPAKDIDVPKAVPKVGMECDIKNLYQKPDGRWTDKYPNHIDEAVENDATARYAILVRNTQSFDARKKLEIESIIVQSPLLKRVLGVVLKDYPGVTASLERLTFHAPFNPFIHRWTEFTQALNEQDDPVTKTHLLLLHKTLQEELKDLIAAKEDYIKNKVITYDHLYMIFQPGSAIYSEQWGRHCASKLTHGSYTESVYGPCYGVNAQRVNWDGDKFGYAREQHFIYSFAGTKKIEDLETFPLKFHSEQQKVKSLLIKRGRLFEQYHGYHYKAYKSFAIGKDMCGNQIKVTVDSRIIIDTFAYGKFNPNSLPNLLPLKIKSRADTPEESDNDEYSYEDEDNDSYVSAPILRLESRINEEANRIPLTDEQLLHCSLLLKGYALKTKRWLSFLVDSVSEITFNTAAFDSLVLPADQKELILAFAESQVKYKESFDDVIAGKGKGIIMLLSGGPGIGKTLTAESVSENMKVPLYMMSAGDLGIRSTEVESNITTILEMVAKWNAVLLLDECDVFLEARSAHDLERNKIVSIFLRTLEYYEGLLFLTTNRAKNMDPAFQSRIHISMEYPSLNADSRKQVWTNFLKGVENELSMEELVTLSQVEINGRQIKNILKTAGLLARHKGRKLRYEHLRTVLNVEKKGQAPEVGGFA